MNGIKNLLNEIEHKASIIASDAMYFGDAEHPAERSLNDMEEAAKAILQAVAHIRLNG